MMQVSMVRFAKRNEGSLLFDYETDGRVRGGRSGKKTRQDAVETKKPPHTAAKIIISSLGQEPDKVLDYIKAQGLQVTEPSSEDKRYIVPGTTSKQVKGLGGFLRSKGVVYTLA